MRAWLTVLLASACTAGCSASKEGGAHPQGSAASGGSTERSSGGAAEAGGRAGTDLLEEPARNGGGGAGDDSEARAGTGPAGQAASGSAGHGGAVAQVRPESPGGFAGQGGAGHQSGSRSETDTAGRGGGENPAGGVGGDPTAPSGDPSGGRAGGMTTAGGGEGDSGGGGGIVEGNQAASAGAPSPEPRAGAAGHSGQGGGSGQAGSGGSGEGGDGGYLTPPGGAGGTAGADDSAAGGPAENDPEPLRFLTSPTILPGSVRAPLSALLRFETDMATTARVTVAGGGESWILELSDPSYSHERALLGMKPDTSYQVTVNAVTEEGLRATAADSWHTPALPATFPEITLLGSDPLDMEPGMTLFNIRMHGILLVVDARGVVRWYYDVGRPTEDLRILANGQLAYAQGNREIVSVDWLGNAQGGWYAAGFPRVFTPASGSIPVDVTALHHAFVEMPSGNLLTLSVETRVIEDYPSSSTDRDAPPEAALVVGDVVTEITREGQVVRAIPLLDILDPRRVGHGSFDSFWQADFPGSYDWSHANAVVYDASSDAYVVSCRHQDAVFKIRRETGALVWILGDPANWKEPWRAKLLTPEAGLIWPYHQHAVELNPGGVGLFDNGNFRAPAFEPPNPPYYSRAVRYLIDEQQRTVTQAWSYGAQSGPDSFFSSHLSDADLQPTTGNVLITAGALDAPSPHVRIVEVSAAGMPVFDLEIHGTPQSCPDCTSFGADRIPDLRFLDLGPS